MRKPKTISLAVFIVLVFSALTASSASAAIECKGRLIYRNIVVKWTTKPLCEATGAFEMNGEWTWVHRFRVAGTPVTGSVSVQSETLSGKPLEIEDKGVGGLKVSCTASSVGTVKPEGEDETTTVTLSSCSPLGTCTKVTEAKAVHLPWKTQLAGTKTTARDATYEGTGGNPGWLMICETLLGKIEDECTTTEGSTAVKNLTSSVEELFDESSGEGSCTIGGTKEGLTFGAFEVLTLSGEALSVE
jgi:hypothetical protein